jgi:hypothetical protein
MRQDWHDDTSELYADLVSRFAKQAIQVQVLARDLERWLKEYRGYLGAADGLISAMRGWVAMERGQIKGETLRAWDVFFSHIENVSNRVFPILDTTIRAKCIEPLQVF